MKLASLCTYTAILGYAHNDTMTACMQPEHRAVTAVHVSSHPIFTVTNTDPNVALTFNMYAKLQK